MDKKSPKETHPHIHALAVAGKLDSFCHTQGAKYEKKKIIAYFRDGVGEIDPRNLELFTEKERQLEVMHATKLD